jgi:dTDP-4-dehydrorhamnose reductase
MILLRHYMMKKIPNMSRPVPSKECPTLAKRPEYYVTDQSKIIESLQIEIPFWGESLKKTCKNYT